MTRPYLLAFLCLLPVTGWAKSPLETAAELGGRAMASDEAYSELEHLCNHYGPRISGSDLLADDIGNDDTGSAHGLTSELTC